MAQPATPAAPPTPTPAPAPRRAGWVLWLLRGLALLVALLLIALAAFVLWARSDGSLATALRLASIHIPLQAEGVHGALLGKSTIRRLVWQQGGTRVEVDDARLRWSPAALLRGQVHVQELSAARVAIAVSPSERKETHSKPPSIPGLPIAVQVDRLRVGTLAWAGPPTFALHDIQASAHADRTGYEVSLENLGFKQGRYRAHATLRSGQAPTITAVAAAALVAPPVQSNAPALPLVLTARVHGPLTQLDIEAQAQLAPTATEGETTDTPATPAALPALPDLAPLPVPGAKSPPSESKQPALTAPAHGLSARARITPWAKLPVASGALALQDFDLARVLPTLPRTALSGDAHITTEGAPPGSWAVQARIQNAAAGAWGQQRVPVEQIAADLAFAPRGSVQIHTLHARVAGGTLDATGAWNAPSANPTATTSPWQVKLDLAGIEPRRILSTLAGPAISGELQAHAEDGGAIAFQAALQAQAGARKPDQHATLNLDALELKTAAAEGRWDAGRLELKQLHVATRTATLDAHGDLDLKDLAEIGGGGALRLDAPGLRLAVDGALAPEQGKGTVQLQLTDAARLLAWARTLPGTENALRSLALSGAATLQGSWRGGWRAPTVQATLTADRFAPTTTIQLRKLQTQLSGTLAHLKLESRGEARLGEQRIAWQLAANGSRTTPKAPLAESNWEARIAQLQVQLSDPDLKGAWAAQLAAPIALTWSAKHALDVAAGTLTVQPPAKVGGGPATVAWGASHWQGATLATTGRLQHLPLQWADSLSGGALTHAGIESNLVFDGGWDVALGKTPRATITLERASGDLNVVASDAAAQTRTRIAAGVHAARAAIELDGTTARATLDWQSERAGDLQGSVQSKLTARRGRDGATTWRWADNASLSGQLQARLPSLASWSVLAPPGWRLAGALQADVRIAGTRAAPALVGTLRADQLTLRSVVDGIFLQDGTLRAHFAGTQLFIDEFLLHGAGADGAGGSVRATGNAGLTDGQMQAHLTVVLDQLRALDARDRQLTLSGKVDTGFADRTLRADGAVTVDHALIVLPDGSRPTLADDVVVSGPAGKLLGAAPPHPASTKAHTTAGDDATTAQINIKLDLGPDFRLKGAGIATRLAGALTLQADGPITQMPEVKGKIETKGGTFHAYGQRLNITQGAIYFSGNATNPGLDIIALRPNYTSDQKVGVQVQGTALLPQVRLYSDPALGDSQTLTWLLLGHASPENGDEAALVQTAALALLSGRGGKGLASTFGLDQLGFSQGGGADNKAASVTLGKRISDKLYAAYEQSLGGAGSVLMIFYELSRRWLVRGQAGQTSAVDLIYKLSYE